MQHLTSRTMAILRTQRLLPTQLILDLPTMTAPLIQRLEILAILVVDLVRRLELPFIMLAVDIARVVAVGLRLFFLADAGCHGCYFCKYDCW